MSNYSEEIKDAATKHGLDPYLIAGQVQIESNNSPWAWNPEPTYRYFWNVKTNKPFRAIDDLELESRVPPSDFPCLAGDPDQEWWAQQSSWGLMQIMGALAREHGFRGLYLPELADPVVNLSLGCSILGALMVWARGNVEQALAAYNGGKRGNMAPPFRNQTYATKVLRARTILKGVS